ncbi:MAG: PEGA domain-containing protein [Deltaproteobacteria bacterium]|nr:MAG: PEGA domain-containing protein [Deltaproteobacteria bacterium]
MPQQEQSAAGATWLGKYELLRKIASGGMGEVFLARQVGEGGFEKILAIKRILPHLTEDETFVRMFLDEARTSARLNHVNIVQIYELGKEAGVHFIAMEYVHGLDLRRILDRQREAGGGLPPALSLFVIREALTGLHYAHRQTTPEGIPLGIVHRDISPQNILISYEGEVKIADFGIARAANRISEATGGMLKGKIAYMSPEQVAGKEVGPASDIFSIGIVLYEVLTGKRPFEGKTSLEILQAIRKAEVPPPSTLDPGLPPRIDEIVCRALARSPEDRYPDARSMALALQEVLSAEWEMLDPAAELSEYLKGRFPEVNVLPSRPVGLAATVVGGGEASLATTRLECVPPGEVTETVLEDTSSPSGWIGGEEGMTVTQTLAGTPQASDAVLPTLVGTPQSRQGVKGPPASPRRWPWFFLLFLLLPLVLPAGRAWIGERLGISPAPPVLKTPISGETVNRAPSPASPPPPAFTPPPRRTLRIVSHPPGATISINGEHRPERTPAEIPDLPAGTRVEILLEKEGFERWHDSRKIEAEGTNELTADLVPIEVPITIDSEPQGAEVYLDGVRVGLTRQTLGSITFGEHRVKLVKPGYRSISFTFRVTRRTPLSFVKQLSPLQREVSIVSDPPGAFVTLDGVRQGTTPLRLPLPTDRTITLLLEKEGYAPAHFEGSLAPGEEKLALTLTPLPRVPLKIDSRPQGIEVVLDGGRKGQTPLVWRGDRGVTVGKHELTFRYAGRTLETRTIQVEAEGDNKVFVAFHGKIAVRAPEKSGTALLDGERHCLAPCTFADVVIGKHQMTFKRVVGGVEKVKTRDLTVEFDQTVEVEFPFFE